MTLRATRIKFIIGDTPTDVERKYAQFAQEHGDDELVSLAPCEVEVACETGWMLGGLGPGRSEKIMNRRRLPAVVVVYASPTA